MKSGLHELFLNELADIFNAEHQLLKALPKMARGAESEELREAFEMHLKETENHIARIEEVFQLLDENPKRRKCKGMEGVIEESKEVLSEDKGSSALDAALIAAAQRAEHYEIASYGCLCTWAEQMGHTEAADILKETLEEEKEADRKLTEIARSSVNMEAETT